LKPSLACLAAAVGLLMSGAAMAASSASAKFDNLTYTLYDLNPGDGVSASITFIPPSAGTHGSDVGSSASDPGAGSQSGSAWSFQVFGAASSTSTVGDTTATAKLSGSIHAGGVDMLAAGSTAGTTYAPSSSSYSASASVGPIWYETFSFDLAPYTLVVFAGSADITATTTIGAAWDDWGFPSESANAFASLSVSGNGPSGGGQQSSSQSLSASASFDQVLDPLTWMYTYVGQSSHETAALAASFANVSGTSLSGKLSASVSISGYSAFAPVTQPVPEPGTWALFGAGLALMGLRAHRRNKA
jgi:hypothetical protein